MNPAFVLDERRAAQAQGAGAPPGLIGKGGGRELEWASGCLREIP